MYISGKANNRQKQNLRLHHSLHKSRLPKERAFENIMHVDGANQALKPSMKTHHATGVR